MISISLSELCNAVGGQLIGADITINSIVTDSRTLQKDQVFLALKGPNFDGHRFHCCRNLTASFLVP